MNYGRRQQGLLRVVNDGKLDALIVTHAANVSYLCGFTGSAGVLLAREPRCVLYTDGRYIGQAHEEVQGAKVVIAKGSPLAAAGASLAKLPRRAAIGIEAEHLTVAGRRTLAASVSRNRRLRDTSSVVEHQRMIKEPEEIERIRAAALAGAALLDTAIQAIAPGVAETAVAAELEYAARKAGTEGMSFDTIVASGPRSALPHGRASAQPIPRNGFVVLDFGVILAGYCSDMTRTVHVGRPSAEMRAVYDAVREAQQAAVDVVRAGVEVGVVDQTARRVLRRARLARYFTHSTGHGVGLEIHEPPRLARAGTEQLRSGMVITVEPGAYIPGRGGVRIEDMLVVTERGADVLTSVPKELIVI